MLSYIIAADSALGRVDVSMLDDRSRMELLISNLPDTSKYVVADADTEGPCDLPEDVCAWTGVKCDESKRITELDWGFEDIPGEVLLDYLPPCLIWADLSTDTWDANKPKRAGTLSTALLPESLVYLDLHNNAFYGSVDFETLPDAMQNFYIWWNDFSGEICLKKLPPTMEDLCLSMCKFSGSVDLSSLPSTLHTLKLSHNSFAGNPNLSALPAIMRVLMLDANDFAGEFCYNDLPGGLVKLSIGKTQLKAVGTGKMPAFISK